MNYIINIILLMLLLSRADLTIVYKGQPFVFETIIINENVYVDIVKLAEKLGHTVEIDSYGAKYIIDSQSLKFVESSFFVVYSGFDSIRVLQMTSTPVKKQTVFLIPVNSFFKSMNEVGLSECYFDKNRIIITKMIPPQKLNNYVEVDEKIDKSEFEIEIIKDNAMPIDTFRVAPSMYVIPEGLKRPR